MKGYLLIIYRFSFQSTNQERFAASELSLPMAILTTFLSDLPFSHIGSYPLIPWAYRANSPIRLFVLLHHNQFVCLPGRHCSSGETGRKKGGCHQAA